jgi:hypothetical protein
LRFKAWAIRAFSGAAVLACTAGFGVMRFGPEGGGSPAIAQASVADVPAVPANGEMSFVVERFGLAQGPYDPAACPNGRRGTIRDEYLDTLPAAERARLLRPENENELARNWRALIFGPGGTNICSNPDLFDRPSKKTVQAGPALGFDLDRGGKDSDSCTHEEFVSPTGEQGIDNQEYRANGCAGEAPPVGAVAGDRPEAANVGAGQFHASGEWTQVLLIRGIDSMVHDDKVEVIYANTADRPLLGLDGTFLPGASFTINDQAPRHRNVLRGRIDNGVLTTEPQDIKLAQMWGQSAGRDLRGVRSTFDFRKARLRLQLHADGTLSGLLGGYRPIFSIIISPSLGGVGSAGSGIDCAAAFSTLRTLADGIRDPQTGKCTGVSSAQRIRAVQAFVTDLPAVRTAKR